MSGLQMITLRKTQRTLRLCVRIKKLALHEKKTSAFKQEHVNLLSTSVNLKKVAKPLYIGVLTT